MVQTIPVVDRMPALPEQDGFLDGIRRKAERLGSDGYGVSEARTPHVYLVTRPDGDGEVTYLVNPVVRTCTCPFHQRQVDRETFDPEGAIVPCKHQLGLQKLVEGTLEAFRSKGDTPRYYALAAHWAASRVEMRRRDRAAIPPVQPAPPLKRTVTALDDVRDRVREDDRGKWDVTVPRKELALQHGRLLIPESIAYAYPDGLVPGSWATAQMCQRLRIPVAYFRRCPTDLQDNQFNHWLHHSLEPPVETDETPSENGDARRERRENWMLRARDSSLRGVLSERYARMDNTSVLDIVSTLLDSRFEIGWFSLTEESLHVRLVDPRLAREALPNDRLMAGIHIANSEVGRRAVTVDAMVFRLVCKNGLIRLVRGESLLHQRHVSFSTPRFETALRDSIHQALIQAAGFMEQLVWSTRQPIPDVDRTLQTLSERWGLSRETGEKVLGNLRGSAPGQQETLYGLVNAITSAAQEMAPDDRYDLETLAGRLMEQGLSSGRPLVIPSRPRASNGSRDGRDEREEG